MATTTVKKTPVLPNAPVTKTNPPVLPGSATTNPTPLANPISTPAPTTPKPINNAQSVTIGDKTFGLDYANDPANAEELRQAIINGRNKSFITDGSGATFSNETGAQLTSAPTVPKFDSQSYINGVITPGNAGIDSANASRIALINARLAEQLGAQDGLIRDAEGNLVKATDTIHANTYDAQETQKANGVQTGIQYSQQQQALQNGISRAGTKMIVDAGKERDTAIANIKDRIASLKSGASYEIQASNDQANSEKSNLLAQTTADANKRDWSIQDLTVSQNYNDKTIADANAFTDSQRIKTAQDRVNEIGINFKNDIEKEKFMQNNRKDIMALEDKLKKDNDTIAYNRDMKALAVKHGYDVEINNANIGADMAKVVYQESQANARNTASINQSNKENQDRIKAEAVANKLKVGAEVNAFANKLLTEDPSFQPYGTSEKSKQQLKTYAELNGLKYEEAQAILGAPKSTVDDAMSQMKITPNTNLGAKTTAIINGKTQAVTLGAVLLGLISSKLPKLPTKK